MMSAMKMPVSRSTPPPDGTYRILVIGADFAYARRLMVALSKARLQCHHAPDAAAALEGWRTLQPHLIVLDLALGEPGAARLCARIRAESLVPVALAVSEQDTESACMEGLRLGADELLAKSLSPRLLRGRVVAQLRRVYNYDWSELSAPAQPELARPRSPASNGAALNGAASNGAGAARNGLGLGGDKGVPQAERELAARAVAVAVQQMSADKVPSRAAPPARSGATVCDACGYSGALESFRAQPGSDTLVCPQCGESGMVSFKLA
jgi:CheY-like chemotaxis protein